MEMGKIAAGLARINLGLSAKYFHSGTSEDMRLLLAMKGAE